MISELVTPPNYPTSDSLSRPALYRHADTRIRQNVAMSRPLQVVLADNVQRLKDAHPEIQGVQENLEKRSGAGQATISAALNPRSNGLAGKAGPTLKTVGALAKGLDVPPFVLLVDMVDPEVRADQIRHLLSLADHLLRLDRDPV